MQPIADYFLFNGALKLLIYKQSDVVICKIWTVQGMEESHCGLLKVLFQHLPGVTM
jgi:hypothetical protein